jgi:carbamate kinase
MTQGWLGYLIQTALEEALGFRRRVITLITRVLVDAKDPSFLNPSKPVGRIVSQREAEELSKRYGWKFKQDPRGGYRRVVPSPEPLEVLELPIIERLIKDGTVVIAAGGGGIPLVRQDDRLMPVEAVIDKDLASALLAIGLRADKFVILTDVEGVAINYGRQDQRWLREVTTEELKVLYAKGEFPPGSMGPKVLAAVRFAEATGNPAIIGSLDEAPDVIAGRRGTIVRRP